MEKYVGLKMPQEIYDALQKEAEADKRTVSAMIRIILEKYFEEKQNSIL